MRICLFCGKPCHDDQQVDCSYCRKTLPICEPILLLDKPLTAEQIADFDADFDADFKRLLEQPAARASVRLAARRPVPMREAVQIARALGLEDEA